MYGAMLGDIVGSIYEFANIKTKDFPLIGRGCGLTDDSFMTIAVGSAALSYAEHKDIDRFTEEVAQEMHRVGNKYRYPIGGYGGMFLSWLLSTDPQPYGSWGNGSAMRASPCGWVAESLEEAELLGAASAAPTHNHPAGVAGAKATAGAVYLARTGATKEQIKDYLCGYYNLDFTLDEIRPTYEFDGSCQGTVPQAMQAFLESTDYEDAIRNAISIGGDSDTIGAITGGVAEAYYGVPVHLRRVVYRNLLEFCDTDEFDLVSDFDDQFCSGRSNYYKNA